MFKEGINCINHKDSKFLFYCFDDKSYLCEECFREHKSHNLEIKSDIKKVSDFVEPLKKSNPNNIKKTYEDTENKLENLKEKIEQILSEIQKLSEKFKESEEIKIPDDISSIKFEEFEKYLKCINIKSKTIDISKDSISLLKKIQNNLQDIIVPTNFKYINKEVSIVTNSPTHSNFNIDILLGKSSAEQYTLFNKSSNHFLIVDLNKKYYLKSIRIQVTRNDCSLKTFVVYIKERDDDENWIKINDFIRKKENQDNQYQSFEIGYYCKQVKFSFIDSWENSGENKILIKKIDFEVGE